jgi:tight adherence protein B
VQLANGGPIELRPAFAAFSGDYQASGRFGESLDRLKERLADPVGDRVVETLRLAREVGGSDLGRLLRTLAAFLREEDRVRGELESRQSWTVNAARLAVAAPWILLVLLATRPQAVAAYNTPAGVVVLVTGALVSIIAYRLMMRIGRLPVETRVLR